MADVGLNNFGSQGAQKFWGSNCPFLCLNFSHFLNRYKYLWSWEEIGVAKGHLLLPALFGERVQRHQLFCQQVHVTRHSCIPIPILILAAV